MMIEILIAVVESAADGFNGIIGDILLIIYVGIMFWSIGSLLSYHSFLIWTNQTTHENLRKTFASHGKNPFNKNVWYNWKVFWNMID